MNAVAPTEPTKSAPMNKTRTCRVADDVGDNIIENNSIEHSGE